jgi:hypothetical protein
MSVSRCELAMRRGLKQFVFVPDGTLAVPVYTRGQQEVSLVLCKHTRTIDVVGSL